MDLPEAQMSEFNSGIATIYRLDSIQKTIAHHKKAGEYEEWFETLEIYWKELRPMAQNTKANPLRTRYDDMYRMAKYCRKIYNYCKSTRKSYPNFIIEFFNEWEFELRDLQQMVGLGVKKKDDPRYAMAR